MVEPQPSQWGLYPWFDQPNMAALVHADDLESIRVLSPYCKLLEAVANDGRYLTLRYRD